MITLIMCCFECRTMMFLKKLTEHIVSRMVESISTSPPVIRTNTVQWCTLFLIENIMKLQNWTMDFYKSIMILKHSYPKNMPQNLGTRISIVPMMIHNLFYGTRTNELRRSFIELWNPAIHRLGTSLTRYTLAMNSAKQILCFIIFILKSFCGIHRSISRLVN